MGRLVGHVQVTGLATATVPAMQHAGAPPPPPTITNACPSARGPAYAIASARGITQEAILPSGCNPILLHRPSFTGWRARATTAYQQSKLQFAAPHLLEPSSTFSPGYACAVDGMPPRPTAAMISSPSQKGSFHGCHVCHITAAHQLCTRAGFATVRFPKPALCVTTNCEAVL